MLFDEPDPEDDLDLEEQEVADEVTMASCPYCGAAVEMLLDTGGSSQQEYIEDCEVCCRPWSVRVTWVDGDAFVELRTEDEA